MRGCFGVAKEETKSMKIDLNRIWFSMDPNSGSSGCVPRISSTGFPSILHDGMELTVWYDVDDGLASTLQILQQDRFPCTDALFRFLNG